MAGPSSPLPHCIKDTVEVPFCWQGLQSKTRTKELVSGEVLPPYRIRVLIIEQPFPQGDMAPSMVSHLKTGRYGQALNFRVRIC